MAKAAKKAPSKTEILSNIATATDLPKKKVAEVLEALTAEIKKNEQSRTRHLCLAWSGEDREEKGSCPAPQKNWLNPFTKQLEDRPAKPASVKVKVPCPPGLEGHGRLIGPRNGISRTNRSTAHNRGRAVSVLFTKTRDRRSQWKHGILHTPRFALLKNHGHSASASRGKTPWQAPILPTWISSVQAFLHWPVGTNRLQFIGL